MTYMLFNWKIFPLKKMTQATRILKNFLKHSRFFLFFLLFFNYFIQYTLYGYAIYEKLNISFRLINVSFNQIINMS